MTTKKKQKKPHTVTVTLEPDVAEVFPTSVSVNRGLRVLIALYRGLCQVIGAISTVVYNEGPP